MSVSIEKVFPAKAISRYSSLRKQVLKTLFLGQQKIEEAKVLTYWITGQLIKEHILLNKDKADYGRKVLERLSQDVGLHVSVLRRTIQFYEAFPIRAGRREFKPRLSWSHYRTLITVPEEKTRFELAKLAENSNWSAEKLKSKIRAEVWPDNALVQNRLGKIKDLKPKRGAIYIYPIYKAAGKERGMKLDLGFKTYRNLSKKEGKRFKEGDLGVSLKNKAGNYSLRKSSQKKRITLYLLRKA